MKTKKLTPRNAAPVQRENTATVARDSNAHREADLYEIAPYYEQGSPYPGDPFAGDDAE